MLEWQVGENGDRATYGLLYDPLNRLDGAVYGFYEPPYGYNRNYRYELSIDYDQNGNITDFWRRGETGSPGSELFSVIDNMDYTYDSEGKLSSVYENSSTTYGFHGSGATANYTYDNNGNLISDANRGISSVDYNHLNLPTKVTYSGGQWIEWTYDALGTKLQKSTSTGDDRYYEGDIEYQNTSLAVIYHEEGFLQPDGSSGFDHYYYLRDHLGNTRLIVQDANSNGSLDTTEIVQENHYYPFGMQMQGDWMGSGLDNYLFNSLERDSTFGLNWDIASFRTYDPSLGRWLQIDPIVKFHECVYGGFGNNPINFIDPLGADTLKVLNASENLFGTYQFPTLNLTVSNGSSNNSGNNGSSLFNSLFSNRFNHWQPMGTGGGLSVNPNFPQFSQFTEDIKTISFNLLSEALLLPVGGNYGASASISHLQKLNKTQTIVRIAKVSAKKTRLTNAELVEKAGVLAERYVNKGGRFAGSAKHKYATELLERYQKIYGDVGLETGTSTYFNNGPGNRGYLDVLDRTDKVIYDWKFGYKGSNSHYARSMTKGK